MGLWIMVFNATSNNISVISWRSVLLVKKQEYPEKTPDLRTTIIMSYINTMAVYVAQQLITKMNK